MKTLCEIDVEILSAEIEGYIDASLRGIENKKDVWEYLKDSLENWIEEDSD